MSETVRNRLMLAIALVMAAIYLFPLYWMYVTALKTGSAMFAPPPHFWPDDPQWGVYADVWQSRDMGRYLWNSTVIALGSVSII
ncbi:carbohydrate ABC transporter permease, partial [Agrobacterium vitis]|nr:carbohydrate ABC transporter permease [Agrobacterium vitis]